MNRLDEHRRLPIRERCAPQIRAAQVAGNVRSGESEHGRHQVERRREIGIPTRRDAGAANHQRDPDHLLVNLVRMVEPARALGKRFAMVSSHQDERIFQVRELAVRRQQAPDLRVGIRDLSIVVIDILERVDARLLLAISDDRLRSRGRLGLAIESRRPGRRRIVGLVGIHVVDPEEQRTVRIPAVLEPRDYGIGSRAGSPLQPLSVVPSLHAVVEMVEAGCDSQASIRQNAVGYECRSLVRIRKKLGNEGTLIREELIEESHAMFLRKKTAEYADHARSGERRSRVTSLKDHAAGEELLQLRRGSSLVAIDVHVVRPECIDGDQQDVARTIRMPGAAENAVEAHREDGWQQPTVECGVPANACRARNRNEHRA